MRIRMFPGAGALAVAAAALGLTSTLVMAQAAKPAARKNVPIPRTADGHPDLSGMYDVATMTPVDRPNGAPLILGEKEAAAIEAYEYQRQVKNDAPIAADRGAPPKGGEQLQPKSYLEFLERAGGGVVGGYNHFWLNSGMKMIEIDGQKRSSLVIDPPDGKVPVMKAEGRERNARYLAGAAAPDAGEAAAAGPPGAFDGPETRPLSERCLLGFGSTSGPPTLPNYFYNNMKQIVQTKDNIMILNEMVHDARIIRMNAQHLPADIKHWMGDSIGRWEGDTLVVDTTNFTSKTQFRGSGEKLHVVERFSWMNDGNVRYRFTVDDPETWDRSWTGEYPWVASKEGLYEYACHEGNYSLADMLRGARAREAEDAAKKQ